MLSWKFIRDLLAYSTALFCIGFVVFVLIIAFMYDYVVIYEPNKLFLIYEIILCLIGFVFFLRIYINFIREFEEKGVMVSRK